MSCPYPPVTKFLEVICHRDGATEIKGGKRGVAKVTKILLFEFMDRMTRKRNWTYDVVHWDPFEWVYYVELNRK